MRRQKRRARDPTTAELTGNMADAVTYLSRVAHDAGLDTISNDLLSISSRLRGELARCDSKMTAKVPTVIYKRNH
jgi:hypothetical protein